MKLFGKIIRLKELQLFAEGAGAGTGEGGSDAGSQTGAQAAAAEAPTAEPTFDELIKGKYKADYDARVQKTIQARMRGAKANEERLAKTEPLLQMLGQKYSVVTFRAFSSSSLEVMPAREPPKKSRFRTSPSGSGFQTGVSSQFSWTHRSPIIPAGSGVSRRQNRSGKI